MVMKLYIYFVFEYIIIIIYFQFLNFLTNKNVWSTTFYLYLYTNSMPMYCIVTIYLFQ